MKKYISTLMLASIAMLFQAQEVMKVELKGGNTIEYKVDNVNRVYFDTNTSDEDLPVETEAVIINDDGTTSNGSRFTGIDEKSFYLDYINYSLEQGHLTVAGYDKMGFKGVAKIVPEIVYKGKNYEVLTISENAFLACTELTTVTIPNSVTTIGENAFCLCAYLESVTLDISASSITFPIVLHRLLTASSSLSTTSIFII